MGRSTCVWVGTDNPCRMPNTVAVHRGREGEQADRTDGKDLVQNSNVRRIADGAAVEVDGLWFRPVHRRGGGMQVRFGSRCT